MSIGIKDDGPSASDRDEERTRLVRIVRQRLESLERAGLDRLSLPAPLGRSPALGAVLPPTSPRATGPAPTRAPAPPRPTPPTPAVVPPKAPPLVVSMTPVAPRGSLPVTPTPATGSLFGEPALEREIPAEERIVRLSALAAEVSECAKCPHLAASRIQAVFGEGSPTARLMFVGEAPGADEDASGRPFVGRAGALLTDMITKGMGLARDEVYIANVLKSRPPENRTPLPDEIAHCLPYLERQINLIRPEFLCLLGKTAASTLLETALPLGRLRGKWHRYRGIPTIVTYHPSALLRNPAWKKDAWADLQTLMLAMGLKSPDRKKPG